MSIEKQEKTEEKTSAEVSRSTAQKDANGNSVALEVQDSSFNDEKSRVYETQDDNPEPEVNLTDAQRKILEQQHDIPTEKIPFYSLFRFTTGKDRLVIAGSVFWAIASGVAFPAMSVCIAGYS